MVRVGDRCQGELRPWLTKVTICARAVERQTADIRMQIWVECAHDKEASRIIQWCYNDTDYAENPVEEQSMCRRPAMRGLRPKLWNGH
jgi:hypothetical protein